MDNTDLHLELGRLIREIREEKGLSQEQLAELADIDRTYVSIIERGLKSLTLDTFEKICKSLDIESHKILENALNETKRKSK